MHDAFEQFGAFAQDAVDNKAMQASKGKVSMPVLAAGAEKSFGSGWPMTCACRQRRHCCDHSRFRSLDNGGESTGTIQLITGFIAK